MLLLNQEIGASTQDHDRSCGSGLHYGVPGSCNDSLNGTVGSLLGWLNFLEVGEDLGGASDYASEASHLTSREAGGDVFGHVVEDLDKRQCNPWTGLNV